MAGLAAGGEHTLLLFEGPAPLARLLSPVWRGGRFKVWQQTLLRKGYALEFASSLRQTNWTPLPTVPGNGALKMLYDPVATSSPCFYRARH